MDTPKYIRVEGQLYRRREEPKPERPQFIRIKGHLYKLAQSGSESVEAIEANDKLAGVLEGVIQGLPEQSKKILAPLYGLLQPNKGTIPLAFAKQEVPKQFGEVVQRVGQLVKFLTEMKHGQADTLKAAALEFAKAGDALSGAAMVGQELKTDTAPAGIPAQQAPSVDWGESAPKQQRASVDHPPFIRVKGHLYQLA